MSKPAVSKPYTFRTINAGDVAPMLRIVKKLGLKDIGAVFSRIGVDTENKDSGEPAESSDKEKVVKKVGVDVALELLDLVIEKLDIIKPDVDALVGSCADLSTDQIDILPINTYFDMLADFFTKPELLDCFTAAAKLVK